EEDAMLRFFRDPQTKEFLIAGTGQQHIEVAVAKMKKRYHTEVNLKAPKVPYRSEEHTSELQSRSDLVCRLLLEKKKLRRSQATQEKCRTISGSAPSAAKFLRPW